MAVGDAGKRMVLRFPLENIVVYLKMVRFKALLEVLDVILGNGPSSQTYIGLDTLYRSELMERIYF